MQARPSSTSTAPPSTRDGTGRRVRGAATAALASVLALLAATGAQGAGADALWPRYSDDPTTNQRLAPLEEEPATPPEQATPTRTRPFVEEDSPRPRAAPPAAEPAKPAPVEPAAEPAAAPPAPPSPATAPTAEAPSRAIAASTQRAGERVERAVQPVADLGPPTPSDGGRSVVLVALLAGSALLLVLSSLPPWLLRDARAADVVLRYRIEAAALGGLGLVFTVALWILL